MSAFAFLCILAGTVVSFVVSAIGIAPRHQHRQRSTPNADRLAELSARAHRKVRA